MDDSGNTYSQTTKYNYSDLCSSTNTDCFVVLNVNWDMNSYSISYTLNDGTVSGNPTSYTIETANITLINPTRNYYTFTGWTGTGLSSATTSVTIPQGSTGNRAYTANWTAQTYPITFIEVKNVDVSFGSVIIDGAKVEFII